VSSQWLEDLVKFEEAHTLKLAPKLKITHIAPTHFLKMRVDLAAQVSCFKNVKYLQKRNGNIMMLFVVSVTQSQHCFCVAYFGCIEEIASQCFDNSFFL